MRLTNEERTWLAHKCSYFSDEYIEYLANFRFDPSQVSIKFIPVSEDGERGRVEFEADGLWKDATLWEVPLMACLSEVYFRVGATDWSYEGQTGKRYLLCSFVRFNPIPQRTRLKKRGHYWKQDVHLANSGPEEGGHFSLKIS